MAFPRLFLLLILFCSISLFTHLLFAAKIPNSLLSNDELPDVQAESWVLLEAQTGWVLAEKNADKRIEPASMTKLMTIYVIFDLLNQGKIDLLDKVTIGKNARYVEGSRMFAELNSRLTVLQLVKGVIVQSGNDASIALAEFIAGSEDAFVSKMNEAVERLNLKNTRFQNVTGLPAENHYSSARDIALIGRAIAYEFPQFYPWFSIKNLTHNGITQPNRNRLLNKASWIDGLKTGHTEAAGYCLAASGKKGDTRLISVVTKARSDARRSRSAFALLNYGFSNYESFSVSPAKLLKRVAVSAGKQDSVEVLPVNSIHAVLPKGYLQSNKVSYEYLVEKKLIAPINEGDNVGVVRVKYDNETIVTSALQAKETVVLGSIFKRLGDKIKTYF